MPEKPSHSELTRRIVEKALSLGASLAGVADVRSLKESPSHRIYPKIGMDFRVRWQDARDEGGLGQVAWPADAVSAVVIGVAHDAAEPELDWWDGKGTPGNRVLMRINGELSRWIESTFAVRTYKPPYMVEKGGIFLKDAAAMAGLGCIGGNNLVITPKYGPRVRFRALLLNREAQATGPLEFDPCQGCEQPCRKACPVGAFQVDAHPARVPVRHALPGTDGAYDRTTCNVKMETDIEEAVAAVRAGDEERGEARRAIDAFEEGGLAKPEGEGPSCCVKYCRRCELSCPVGK